MMHALLQVIAHLVYTKTPKIIWEGVSWRQHLVLRRLFACVPAEAPAVWLPQFGWWHWEVDEPFERIRMEHNMLVAYAQPQRLLALAPGVSFNTTTEQEFRDLVLQVRRFMIQVSDCASGSGAQM